MNSREILKEMEKIKEKNPFISSKELAYQVILNQIIQRTLQKGEKIVQDTLAESMCISRSPIREALMKLEEEGFLEKKDKSSYIVAGIRLKDYVDYCEMRLRMESYAAMLAVQNMTEDLLPQMKKNLEQFLRTENLDEIRKLDEEFHGLIIKAANNPYITEFHRKTEKRKEYYSRYLVHAENLTAARIDHRRIYEAVRQCDARAAEEGMRIHLSNYLNKLYEIM